jgi:hypothetical protein
MANHVKRLGATQLRYACAQVSHAMTCADSAYRLALLCERIAIDTGNPDIARASRDYARVALRDVRRFSAMLTRRRRALLALIPH